jgi:hypothetical protein
MFPRKHYFRNYLKFVQLYHGEWCHEILVADTFEQLIGVRVEFGVAGIKLNKQFSWRSVASIRGTLDRPECEHSGRLNAQIDQPRSAKSGHSLSSFIV